MHKKYRYSFAKVCFWVVLLNVVFAVLTLVVLFNVRQPFQTVDVHTFSIPHYMGRLAAGTRLSGDGIYYALR